MLLFLPDQCWVYGNKPGKVEAWFICNVMGWKDGEQDFGSLTSVDNHSPLSRVPDWNGKAGGQLSLSEQWLPAGCCAEPRGRLPCRQTWEESTHLRSTAAHHRITGGSRDGVQAVTGGRRSETQGAPEKQLTGSDLQVGTCRPCEVCARWRGSRLCLVDWSLCVFFRNT